MGLKTKTKILLLLINVSLIEEFIMYIFKFTGVNPLFSNYTSQIIYMLVIAFLLLDLIMSNNKNKFKSISLLLIITSLFAYSYLKYHQFRPEILTSYRIFFVSGFLVYYFSVNMVIDKRILTYFKPYIYISIITSICYLVSNVDLGNQMLLAYSILPSVIVLIFMYLEDKKIFYIFILLFLIFILFILENRGSIIILIASALIIVSNSKITNKIILLLGVILLCLITILLMPFLENYFNNRILSSLFNGQYFNDNIRLFLWNEILADSVRNPLRFNSVLYDRVYLVSNFKNNTNIPIYIKQEGFMGLYAHNFFIEIISQYGLLISSIIVMILIKLVTTNLKTTDSKGRIIYLVIVSYVFLNLMISSSYLINSPFWLFIGVSVNLKSRAISSTKFSIQKSKMEYKS